MNHKIIRVLGDCEFAIIETDSDLSVLPKPRKQPLTPTDLHTSTSYQGLTRDVIIDGNIMRENLRGAGLDNDWLMKQLNYLGIKDPKEVFYAGLDTAGDLYVSRKDKPKEL